MQQETTTNMNPLRCGSFTSSEIFKLLAKGKEKGSMGAPCLTLIEECNMERRLNRSISNETDAKPLSWGKVCEKYVFSKMDTSYKLASSEVVQHPKIKYWVGSPEGNKFDEGKTVYDIKCPMTLKSFCRLVLPIYEGLTGKAAIDAVRMDYVDKSGFTHDKHKDGEKYYQQIVSNAILTDSKWGELKVFAPFKSEIEAIKEVARNWDGDQNPFAWIHFAQEDGLPWIPDNGFYENINTIRFEIPQEDKDNLTAAVVRAGGMLKPYFTVSPPAEKSSL